MKISAAAIIAITSAALLSAGCGKAGDNKDAAPPADTAIQAPAITDSGGGASAASNADTAKDTHRDRLVNAAKELWEANIGGHVATTVHLVAITFLADSTFIYRNAHKELETEEWAKITGTTGKWHADGGKITMAFDDGYTVTASYAITNDILSFDFGEGYNPKFGDETVKYYKVKIHLPESAAANKTFEGTGTVYIC